MSFYNNGRGSEPLVEEKMNEDLILQDPYAVKLFPHYIYVFETKFIPEGITKGVFNKHRLVSVRNGKLSRTPFGQFLGNCVHSDLPFALDYYGHIKKSNGLLSVINFKLNAMPGRQIKKVESTIVHFASITIEDLSKVTSNSFIIAKFYEFKQTLLKKRGYLYEN
jgi:hypothetical protein